MEHISDYVRWRGCVPFEAAGFNVIDNIVLCDLTYLELGPVRFQGPVELRSVLNELNSSGNVQKIALGNDPNFTAFTRLVADSERFGTLKIAGIQDEVREDISLQFCAVTYELSPDTAVVVFRGTDDSLAGWKEDFMLSFTKTEAQLRAEAYLREACGRYGSVYVAGHSKGGNLAMYASCMLSDSEYAKIRHIYINDGPGFCGDILDPGLVQRIDAKSTVIFPEESIVGRIFEPQITDRHIVKSDAEGVNQHAPTSWAVTESGLDEAQQFSPASDWVADVIEKWLAGAPLSERKAFVDTLFDALANGRNHSLADISESGVEGIENVLVNLFGADASSLRMAFKLPEAVLLDEVSPEIKKAGLIDRLKSSETATACFLIVIGILILLIPHIFMQTALLLSIISVTVFELYITIRNLRRNGWDFEKEHVRVTICIALIAVIAILLVKDNALYILSGAIFGIYFLSSAYGKLAKCKNAGNKLKNPHFYRLLGEALVELVLGAFILVAPEHALVGYMYSVSVILILEGVARLVIPAITSKLEKERKKP